MGVRTNTLRKMYSHLQAIKIASRALGLNSHSELLEKVLENSPIMPNELTDDEFEIIINDSFDSFDNFFDICFKYDPFRYIEPAYENTLNKESKEVFKIYKEDGLCFLKHLVEYTYVNENEEMFKHIEEMYKIYETKIPKDIFIDECRRLKYPEKYIETCSEIFYYDS